MQSGRLVVMAMVDTWLMVRTEGTESTKITAFAACRGKVEMSFDIRERMWSMNDSSK
jgi:hypothetical protein